MFHELKLGAIIAMASTALACHRSSEVEQQAQELREAQARSPQVAKEIESELAKARERVVQLEQKLALAQQGITDEVLSERKDLQQALKRQEQHVKDEFNQAQREAEQHDQDATKAQQALEATKPPALATHVDTPNEVIAVQSAPVQTKDSQDIQPVSGRDEATPALPSSPVPPIEADAGATH
jgi:gas vesicle protein